MYNDPHKDKYIKDQRYEDGTSFLNMDCTYLILTFRPLNTHRVYLNVCLSKCMFTDDSDEEIKMV